MLEINNIYKTFNIGTINEKHALNGVSLTLNDGDFVTVIGGNGAGKSTLLNAIAGVWPVDSGSLVIDGTDVTGLPEYKRASYLGRVFQDPMTGTSLYPGCHCDHDPFPGRDHRRTLLVFRNRTGLYDPCDRMQSEHVTSTGYQHQLCESSRACHLQRTGRTCRRSVRAVSG